MRLLYTYLRRYWRLVTLALVLATINQVFSLLDPLIFRHVIDQYATRFDQYTVSQFIRGVSLLLLAAVSVAFVSRGGAVIGPLPALLGARLDRDVEAERARARAAVRFGNA